MDTLDRRDVNFLTDGFIHFLANDFLGTSKAGRMYCRRPEFRAFCGWLKQDACHCNSGRAAASLHCAVVNWHAYC
jgi:hypothetical protein